MRIQLAIIGLSLAWASQSGAEAVAADYYVAVETGASIVPDQTISGGGLSGVASLDTGFNVGGALGGRLGDHVRAEVNLSYRRSGIDQLAAPGVILAGAGNVGLFSAMANVYWDILPDAAVIPYLGAGLGLGVVSVDSDAAANVLIVNDSAVAFAWNILAGASVPVSERISLSLGYRYLATTRAELAATLVGAGTGTIGAKFDAHEVVFGAKFWF